MQFITLCFCDNNQVIDFYLHHSFHLLPLISQCRMHLCRGSSPGLSVVLPSWWSHPKFLSDISEVSSCCFLSFFPPPASLALLLLRSTSPSPITSSLKLWWSAQPACCPEHPYPSWSVAFILCLHVQSIKGASQTTVPKTLSRTPSTQPFMQLLCSPPSQVSSLQPGGLRRTLLISSPSFQGT